ncbi:MAG: NAD-dependent DNA ligase LigA [Clostridia bacterium]|nr:NAD-dependent DNA ligase LigA [Clostridia bacterium]
MTKLEEMKKLVEEVNYYSYAYYTLDKPLISDNEWDKLYFRLVALEKETGIVLPNSPTVRVGGEPLSEFNKVPHTHKIYSLDKAQSLGELDEWEERNQKLFRFKPIYSVEYKYDGLNLSLLYKNGELVLASTRGNGFIGEDVTSQVKTVRTVPLTIGFKGEVEVQGEVVMRISELNRYNQTSNEPLKNARNAAAGAIRNLDPKVTAKRNLDFVAYNINFIEGKALKTIEEMHNFLIENKFFVGSFFKIANGIGEVKTIISEVGLTKDSLDILIDGMVIKVNDYHVRDELGNTEKFPRASIAFKFEANEASTMLNSVTWQVGRTGKLTPVAELEPVELAGVTIKRATLNNYNDIVRKGVKLHSRVFLRRSNEVIPEILALAEEFNDSEPIIKPNKCPVCGSTLTETEADLFCPNHNGCAKQIIERLTHFVSRDAMNIDGLSRKTIEQLHANFNVKNFSDLYKLTREQVASLEGFKDKKIDNYFASLERSKTPDLANFIFALGIDNVGKKTAKQLASRFKSIEGLMKATKAELADLNDIGELTAQYITHYFFDENNLFEIESLREAGVKVKNKTNSDTQLKLAGIKFVLTGTLPTLKRNDAAKIIEENGGEVMSSVSKNTDLVLAGADAGSKLDKAVSLGIKIISEDEFLKMV